jgi:hypothetical protein
MHSLYNLGFLVAKEPMMQLEKPTFASGFKFSRTASVFAFESKPL